MNHQFKNGDLAMIIGCRTDVGLGNIGKCVELVEELPFGKRHMVNGTMCMAAFGDSWVVSGDGLAGMKTQTGPCIGSLAVVLKEHLIPLRGDFAPEQQKVKEVEPCA